MHAKLIIVGDLREWLKDAIGTQRDSRYKSNTSDIWEIDEVDRHYLNCISEEFRLMRDQCRQAWN